MARNILITGGARRLGAVLVRNLAARGDRIVLHHNRSAAEALAVQEEVRAAGGVCELLRADLTSLDQRDGLIDAAADALGGLDALVNNAALFDYDTLDGLTDARWAAHLALNLTAPVFLIRDLLRRVTESGGPDPVAVNILDHKINSPNPDYFSYTAAKTGLAGLTEALALAASPRLRVCGVAPGLIYPSGPQTEADFRAAVAATPLGRTNTPEDVARAVCFVLDTASFHGRILTVDGGESLVGRARDVAFDPTVNGHRA